MYQKTKVKAIISVAVASICFFGTFSLNAFAESAEEPPCDIIYGYSSESGTVETESEQEFTQAVDGDDQIQVVYQLDYEPYESDFRDQIDSDSSLDEVHALVAQFREEQRAYYCAKNLEFLQDAGLNENSSDYTVDYSYYSPFVQVSCDYETYAQNKTLLVNNVSKDCDVSNIEVCVSVDLSEIEELSVEEELQAEASSAQSSELEEPSDEVYPMRRVLSDIGVYSNDTYKGGGIKVGILESSGVATSDSHSELNGLNIITSPENAPISEHAKAVTRVLCGSKGIAPEVSEVYIYHCNGNYFTALNWAMNQGCDVVNLSIGSNNDSYFGKYIYSSAICDYFVRYSYITIVAVAGNTESGSIAPPGTGYNVITVANSTINKNINSSSAYAIDSIYHMTKPNIAAPGTRIMIPLDFQYYQGFPPGTSISAPIVTGVIAKLMSQYPGMIVYPAVVGAVLMTSATKLNGQGEEWDTYGGAGLINYANAKTVLDNNWFRAFTLSVSVTSYTKEFMQGTGTRIKMVAYWFANTQFPNENSDNDIYSDQYNIHTRYYLYLYAGTTLVKSSTSASNIQYINTLNYADISNMWSFRLNINGTKTNTDLGAVAWFYE